MSSKSRSFLRISLAALALASIAAGPAWAGMKLAVRGRSEARIVVAPGASETERFAAQELALFLHIVTGATFPVVEDPGPAGGRLLVGLSAARAAAPDLAGSGLAPEEIVVRSVGDDLVLAGGSPARHALRRLHLPRRRRRLPLVDRDGQPHALEARRFRSADVALRYKPPLEYREPYWYRRLRRRLGGPQQGQRHAGRRRRAARRPPGLRGLRPHVLFPHPAREVLRRDHPEWFSEIDGKRTSEERPALPDQRGHAPGARQEPEGAAPEPIPRPRSPRSRRTTASATAPARSAGPSTRRKAARPGRSFASSTPSRPTSSPSSPHWPSTPWPTSTRGSRRCSSGPGRTSSSASAASNARSAGRSTTRATRPSSTTSTAGRRSPSGSTSGTTRRTSRTTSSPTRTTAFSPRISGSSSTGTSGASSNRAPTSPGAPRWPSSGPGCWPSCSGTPASTRISFATNS